MDHGGDRLQPDAYGATLTSRFALPLSQRQSSHQLIASRSYDTDTSGTPVVYACVPRTSCWAIAPRAFGTPVTFGRVRPALFALYPQIRHLWRDYLLRRASICTICVRLEDNAWRPVLRIGFRIQRAGQCPDRTNHRGAQQAGAAVTSGNGRPASACQLP